MFNTQRHFREERGLALIEMAIVILLLLLITFGLMEFGWLFHRIQQVNNSARAGARQVVLPDSTAADGVAIIDQMMTDFGIAGHSVTVSPNNVEDLDSGQLITVTVQVPVSSVELTGLFLTDGFLGSTLSTSVTMAKESP